MEARIDSFCPMGVAVTPAVPAGTRKPRTPSSVLAQTTMTSAMEASPIQRLAPSRIQPAPSPVPSCRAKVVIDDGSEPAVGSVSAKQPITSPAAIRGSHSCFWSSEPHLWIARHGQRSLDGDERADPGIAGLQLHGGQAVFDGGAARAAVALQVHAQHAELAELRGARSSGKTPSSYQPAMSGRIRWSVKSRIRCRRISSSGGQQ